MLQSLELANQFPELLALLEVVGGSCKDFIGQSQQLGGRDDPADIQHAFEPGCTFGRRGNAQAVVDPHAVEAQPCGVVRIDHAGALDGHARCFARHQQQYRAGSGAGCDDPGIGDMAVDDERLGAIERPRAVFKNSAGRETVGPVTPPFVDRQRDDHFGRGYSGQPGLRELQVALLAQKPGPQHGGGEKWAGRQSAADLLGDQASLHHAQAQAAMGLGHQHAAVALPGKFAPESGVVAVRGVGVTQGTQVGNRHALRQEGLRAVAQHALLLIQNPGHELIFPCTVNGRPRLMSATPEPSWQ